MINMKNKIAIIGIIVEDNSCINELNDLLHKYNEIIIGRMGVPYRDRKIGVISIIIDSDNDTINSLSGKLGKISGITSKTMFAKVAEND
jgi:putative iron-only hydrogenase system regulator